MREKILFFKQKFVWWRGDLKIPILFCSMAVILVFFIEQVNICFSINGFGKLSSMALSVYVFDVGQASSTLIVTGSGQTILIDTGSEDSAANLVQDIEWVLDKNHLSGIDLLLLTHSDSDHVGGVESVLKNFDVQVVYRPKIASTNEVELVTQTGYQIASSLTYANAIDAIYACGCEVEFVESETLALDVNTTFTIYAAENDSYSDVNSFSPFVVLQCNDVSFMFTGDATEAREEEFLAMLEAQNLSLDIDFLQVAHHGSKYSSSQEFLSAISPSFALISAGDDTHPSQQVISRLNSAGVSGIYVTKNCGSIGVGVSQSGEYCILTSEVYIDLPAIVVVIFCFAFVFMHLVDLSEQRRRRANFQQYEFSKKILQVEFSTLKFSNERSKENNKQNNGKNKNGNYNKENCQGNMEENNKKSEKKNKKANKINNVKNK